MSKSLFERLSDLPHERRDAFIARLDDVAREALLHNWQVRARPEQLPPPGA